MTGTIILGPLKPRNPTESMPKNLYLNNNLLDHYQQPWRKMTSASQHGQPIQLTPLWEYVVRTRKFPPNIDIQSTFYEISERLNDPEWVVRQHALRVLIDVLPTLDVNIVDKRMKYIVPELVKNLGNSAPAVRKGSLDALRVYLLHSRDRDTMIRNILQEGLNRPDALDNFQTNITMGVLLSTPLLLFPSKGIPRPSVQVLKEATQTLSSHLIQVTHQEAALKSLIKIRESVGAKEFDSYLQDIDNKVKSDFEMLCNVYKVKLNYTNKQNDGDIKKSSSDTSDKRTFFNMHGDFKKALINNFDSEQFSLKASCERDSDTSGIVEEDEEAISESILPARVVLETEIKFNEETAITMSILEEKGTDSDDLDEESDSEEEHGDCDLDEQVLPTEEQRKTSRRVHFGGEVVKLRTPDSDDTVSTVKDTPKTRIPLPISPATKMPKSDLRARPSSQPCSPRHKQHIQRPHRSHSSSPRREVYVHKANLSPKKGILTRTSSPVFVIDSIKSLRSFGRRGSLKKARSDSIDILTWKRMEANCRSKVDIPLLSETKAFRVCPEPEIDNRIEEEANRSKSAQEGRLSVPISPKENGVLSSETSRFIKDSRNNRTLRGSFVLTDDDVKDFGALESKSINKNRVSLVNSGSKKNIDSDLKLSESKNSSPLRGSPYRRRSSSFEVFPRQERNYILMELSSPVKHVSQKKESPLRGNSAFGSIVSHDNCSGSDLNEKTIADVDSPNEIVSEILKLSGPSSPKEIVAPKSESTLSESNVKEVIMSLKSFAKNEATVEKEEIASSVKSNFSEHKSQDISSEKVLRKVWENSKLGMENELKCKEPNWEELRLVDQEVLHDLHNKVSSCTA